MEEEEEEKKRVHCIYRLLIWESQAEKKKEQ